MVEKFKFGQFSLTEEERKQAEQDGTLAEKEAQMNRATETLRVQQAEKAVEQLEKAAADQEDLDKAA